MPRARGADLALEMIHVGAQGVGRLAGRVGKVREQAQVVEVGEAARQVLLDEAEGAAQRLEPDLHGQARRLLDVLARRLQQARRLTQLGHDAARALGDRRIGEQHLARQAGRESSA